MPQIRDAMPQVSVALYKTTSRASTGGGSVSGRYGSRSAYIDLTPFLQDGSSIHTSKSLRQAAGAFSITLSDMPYQNLVIDGTWNGTASSMPEMALETLYGLIEPQDMVEIRMWHGIGPMPDPLPIKMRGIITDISRTQMMGQDGRPQRTVTLSGHDYGKFWQMYQVLYLPSYVAGGALLSTYAMAELFGTGVENALPAGEFVSRMINSVINPFIADFMPQFPQMPTEIKTDISVQRGTVGLSYQAMQGSIYDITKLHGDVGVWNELYLEDREDGVYCVYRPTPAMELSQAMGGRGPLVMADAPEPIDVPIYDDYIESVAMGRSDQDVANFYWVTNAMFDLNDTNSRKLFDLQAGNDTVFIPDYFNAAVRYYGVRPMYAETHQAGNATRNHTSGLKPAAQAQRGEQFMDWITSRRIDMLNLNRDNVMFERGTARIKGGPMRASGEAMKPGDYAVFYNGNFSWRGYVTQIDDEFRPFDSYMTTLTFERGTNFAQRTGQSGGANSPWLLEQSMRGGEHEF